MIEILGTSHSSKLLLELAKKHRQMGLHQSRLSTGYYVNRAEEDPVRFSLAFKLESRVRGQAQALANIEHARDLLNIKEQSMHTVQEILLKIQDKATQAANDTLDAQARQFLNLEVQAIEEEITNVLTDAFYGDVDIDPAISFTFQVDEGAESTSTFENRVGTIRTLAFGDLNEGIASWDALSGIGYIMHTEEDIYSRFGANPGIERADHLVAVVNQGGQWYWSAWHGLTPFTPTGTDQLLAEVDFDADTVQNLVGQDTVINGIRAGYETGDLVVTPNQFGNPPAASPDDFYVQGTQVVVAAPTLSESLAIILSQLDVSTTGLARRLLGTLEIAFETLHSELEEVGTFQHALSLKSSFISERIISGSQSQSRIEDADFAREQVELVKLQILQNAGVASLAQSVTSNNLILELL